MFDIDAASIDMKKVRKESNELEVPEEWLIKSEGEHQCGRTPSVMITRARVIDATSDSSSNLITK